MQKVFYLVFVFLVSISNTSFSQKYDHHWLMGYGAELSSDTFGLSHLNFNNDSLTIDYLYSTINFDFCNTTFSDSNGEMLFYTNGIEIYNAEHEQLYNSQDFNDSPYHDNFSNSGLRLVQAAIALPASENSAVSYVFHLKLELEYLEDEDSLFLYCLGIYYTKVDMNGDNGLGEVIEKGVPIIEDTLAIGELTATRHANGRDWWLLMPEYNSNRYYRILLNESGANLLESQTVGTSTLTGLGQACFSPDGNWYVRNNMLGNSEVDDYLDIYRFDRCSGLLSEHLRFPYGHGVNAGGGTVISPDSRLMYVCHRNHVYQYDLEAGNIEASKDTVAIFDGFLEEGVFATTFFLGQLAPDGKIYMNCTNSVSYLHLIHNPNGQGSACRFEQRGVDLPTYNAFSLPNFPNYRLGPIDGSPCDTLGIDNIPLAAFNYFADSSDDLTIHFWDYSYYEPTEWEWTFGDSDQGSGQTPMHTYSAPGIYEVCLTASNEYGSDDICKLIELSPTGIKEILSGDEKVTLFPNLARDELTLSFTNPLDENAVLNLYNSLGQKVSSYSLKKGQRNYTLSLNQEQNGIYFYSIESGKQTLGSGKLLISR